MSERNFLRITCKAKVQDNAASHKCFSRSTGVILEIFALYYITMG